MKTVILYDSAYGNTEKIARMIGDSFTGDVKVYNVRDYVPSELQQVDLLIVGSPTQGGRAGLALQEFFKKIPQKGLTDVFVAAFDTRFAEKDQNIGLQILMKIIGYAAPKIAKELQSKGGKLIVPPEGFIVTGKEGPLGEGEIKHASEWGNTIMLVVEKSKK